MGLRVLLLKRNLATYHQRLLTRKGQERDPRLDLKKEGSRYLGKAEVGLGPYYKVAQSTTY